MGEHMKRTYENTFVQGRELTKKLIIAAVIYVMVKYCRCPHCGKRIMFGVLKITVCPSCRRSLITGKKAKKGQF